MASEHTVLEVEHLGKRYVIGGRDSLNISFREMLENTLKAPINRYKKLSGQVSESEKFWALKDVSFSISQGEVVGIIGKNGAGKSTLLKILSRITIPTEGQVTIRGKVASLLEVGTGFHPELTGRENIYLNGAILGMTRQEINAKFDQIVEFANIEQFVDTPVKRYSSGMFVRLAFSIAAHLDPDILIVDEVLAVGDADFQTRCLGKLNDIATSGRTVIFVSHNISSVSTLCNRCICLHQGTVRFNGETGDILRRYEKEVLNQKFEDYSEIQRTEGAVHITKFQLLNCDCHEQAYFSPCSSMHVELSLQATRTLLCPSLQLGLYNHRGQRISMLDSTLSSQADKWRAGLITANCRIDELPLSEGRYYFNLTISEGKEILIAQECAVYFTVRSPHSEASHSMSYGPLVLNNTWEIDWS